MVDIAYFGFFSHDISVLNVECWGGGVEHNMIQHIATRTRDAFVLDWIGFWSLVSGFDGTFKYFDD